MVYFRLPLTLSLIGCFLTLRYTLFQATWVRYFCAFEPVLGLGFSGATYLTLPPSLGCYKCSCVAPNCSRIHTFPSKTALSFPCITIPLLIPPPKVR